MWGFRRCAAAAPRASSERLAIDVGGKMKRVKRSATLVGFAAVVLLGVGALSASAGSDGGESRALTGSWIVMIDRGPAGPLTSLQTYARGGGFVETANAVPNKMRGPGYGSWRRAGHRRYDATELFFRYDPEGNVFLGYLKLRMRIQLSNDGDSFTAVTVAQALDANRNPIGPPRTDSAVGERLDVEPIPG
jgi:hypothetical protein